MNELAGILHITRKAGKLLVGRTAVMGKINSGREVYAFIASDPGKTLLKKLTGVRCEKLNLSSSELGEIFDRERISLIGITDRGLAGRIRELAGKESREPITNDRV